MAGDAASHMLMLTAGQAKYVQEPQSANVEVSQVMDVASDKWICESALWMMWVHVGTMEAHSNECEATLLNVERFLPAILATKLRDLVRAFAFEWRVIVIKAAPPRAPWPTDIATHGTEYIQILQSMDEPGRHSASFLALECASNKRMVDEAQWSLLKEEILKGKANIALNQVGSCLSLVRVVSVVRVYVSRFDRRLLVELGKRVNGSFIVQVQMPGAKQRDSEGIFATLDRVVDSLEPAVGQIDLISSSPNYLLDHSTRTKLKTHYSFFDVNCWQKDFRVSEISQSGRTSLWRSSWTLPRTLSNVGTMLEQRLRSRGEVFFVAPDRVNGEQSVCAWLSQAELDFVKSRSGVHCVETLFADGEFLQSLLSLPAIRPRRVVLL